MSAAAGEDLDPVVRSFLVSYRGSKKSMTPRLSLRSSPPKKAWAEVFSLSFNADTGLSEIAPLEGSIPIGSVLLDDSDAIHDILKVHSAICQIMMFNPSLHGFIPIQRNRHFMPWRRNSKISLYLESSLLYPYAFDADFDDILSKDFLQHIPKPMRSADVVWCPEGTDYEVFGAPCILPVTSMVESGEDEEAEASLATGWALHLRGLEDHKPLARVRWDDEAGIAQIVEQAKTLTSDAGLALFALGSSEEARSDMREMHLDFLRDRQGAAARRDWRSGLALRPRLLTNAVNAAAREAGVHNTLFFTKILSDMTFRGVDQPSPRSEMARRCFLLEDAPQSLRTVGEILQTKLDERKLGEAFIATDVLGRESLFVVKDGEYLSKYHAIFGILDATTIHPLRP